MLTKADDFPVHQLPEPIATAGTDRNFYDRYFFNGYTWDGSLFFALALGVYPHLNIMDAAFSVVLDGVQHNLRASRILHSERMDTRVGPIQVEVLEPLQKLRIRVVDNDHGVSGELVFDARAKPVEEPRFIRRYGPRMIMDYTRMTQNGAYTGWIEVKDKRIEIAPDTMIGTRDRSWGVRPIGASDPQPVAPRRPPQTFWIWSPLNFRDAFMLYHLNDEASGKPWNTASSLGLLGDGEPTQMAECAIDIKYKSGTRHAKSALIKIADEDGRAWRAELDCKYNFYMCGIGYTHPEWGHGMYRGELDVGYDCFETAAVAENTQLFWHVQAFVTASLTGPDGVREGVGVLEQIAVGPHAPSGFKEIYDLAP